MTKFFWGFVVVTLLPCLQTANAQGPLDPIAAPGATMKSLDQIESRTAITSLPYTISSPGSYYLIANLTGIAATSGIIVATNDVTIDLNGYALIGVPSSTYGIQISYGMKNIWIKNGIIKNWGNTGLSADNSRNCKITDITASENAFVGLTMGYDTIVSRCTAYTNNLTGICVFEGSLVSECTAFGNGIGIDSANGKSTISKCTSAYNTSTGITAGNGTTIADCTLANNGTGIAGPYGCQIMNCTIYNNANGISVFGSCYIYNNDCVGNNGPAISLYHNYNRVDSNHLSANGGGIIDTFGNNIIVRNSAMQNGGSNYVLQVNTSFGGSETNAATFTNFNPWVNFDL